MCDTKTQISNKNSISNEISTVNSLNDNPCPTNQYPTKTSNVPLHEHYVSSFLLLNICVYIVVILTLKNILFMILIGISQSFSDISNFCLVISSIDNKLLIDHRKNDQKLVLRFIASIITNFSSNITKIITNLLLFFYFYSSHYLLSFLLWYWFVRSSYIFSWNLFDDHLIIWLVYNWILYTILLLLKNHTIVIMLIIHFD